MYGKKWTEAEDALLRERYPTTLTDLLCDLLPGRSRDNIYQHASRIGLRKDPAWLSATMRQTLLDPEHGSKKTQWQPGMVPHNKGVPFNAGGGSIDTRFRAGNLPVNIQPIGYERWSKDGYLERKVRHTHPKKKNFEFVHRLLWLESGREIPPGHIVIFRDRNPQHLTLDNLECISRQELMRRNSFRRWGPEIAGVIMLRGAINKQIHLKEKKANENHR